MLFFNKQNKQINILKFRILVPNCQSLGLKLRLPCLKAVAKLAVDKFAVIKFAVDKLAVEKFAVDKFAVGQKSC